MCALDSPQRPHIFIYRGGEKLEKKAKALIGNISKMRLEAPEILDTVFSMLDRDGSGFIEKKEWHGAIGMLEALSEDSTSPDVISKLYDYAFDLLDVDGSGAVNFADFLLLMKSAITAGLKIMEKMVELGRPFSSALVESFMKEAFADIREEVENENEPIKFEPIFELFKNDGGVKDYLEGSEDLNKEYRETKQELFGGMDQLLPGYKQFEIM